MSDGSVDLQGEDRSVSFQLRVDRGVYALRLRMEDSQADLDLQVLDSQGRQVWSAETEAFNEQLDLYRLGSPALEDGVYQVKVAWLHDYRPSRQGQSLEAVAFRIGCESVRGDKPAALAPGQSLRDQLLPERCMMLAAAVTAPAGLRELRLDAWSRTTDIDLFAQVGKPFGDPRDVDLVSQSYRPRESLVVSLPASGAATKVYVMVVSTQDTVPADVVLSASAGSAVPAGLTGLPVLAAAARQTFAQGLESASRATVEIIADQGGGSGCVISPEGWIITNRHVVVGGAGQVPRQVSVGFSLDHAQPPDCQFWARVVETDAQRDLALLRIESGFYGQALPPDYRFPSLDLGSGRALRIGQELFFAGYPTIGGLGNRATFTLTNGRVGGFQDRGFGVLVKSAAEISAGNSGGAALDEDWRLVGLPTIVAGDETSRLAFIYPVELIPDAWLKQAGAHRLE